MKFRKWFDRRPDRYLTIKVITDTGATTRNYVVSRRVIHRAKIVGGIAIILFVVGLVAIVDGFISHNKIAALSSRNEQLESRTQNISALKSELAEIWLINERLQRMLGGGRTEKASQPATRMLPWGSPLARWAGESFGVALSRPKDGVNLLATPGTLVLATAAGTVRDVRWDPENGDVVFIDHGNSVQSAYGRDVTIFLQPGEHIAQGQTIGIVQDAGGERTPMVYYKVLVDGSPVNPLVAMTGLSTDSHVYPVVSAN